MYNVMLCLTKSHKSGRLVYGAMQNRETSADRIRCVELLLFCWNVS